MVCSEFLCAGSNAAVRTGGTRRVSHKLTVDDDHALPLSAGKLDPLRPCSQLQTSYSLLPNSAIRHTAASSAMFDDAAQDSHGLPAISSSTTTIQQLGHDRVTSIDMALELERQLHSEHDDDGGNSNHSDVNQPSLANVGTSPDPLILASIITNLRNELTEATAERDRLSEMTSNVARESELRNALALVTGKAAALEEELAVLKLKNTADEETIAVLRTKVEESR